jgi:FtsH-binding integral membrane protein
MKDYTKRQTKSTFGTGAVEYDEGLRSYMIKVYNNMMLGLGFSGLVSLAVMNIPAVAQIAFAGQWVWFIALIVMAFAVVPRMMSMSESGAKMAFYGYALILSLAISPLFFVYTAESVARVFFITAAMFGAMSLYGYTTKKDLTSLGTFAAMGIIGVFIAGLVNIFIGSEQIHFIASIVAVIAITALTAYDTQNIKQTYYSLRGNAEAVNKAVIFGAFRLYFDFVYMFIHLLQFFGERR